MSENDFKSHLGAYKALMQVEVANYKTKLDTASVFARPGILIEMKRSLFTSSINCLFYKNYSKLNISDLDFEMVMPLIASTSNESPEILSLVIIISNKVLVENDEDRLNVSDYILFNVSE